MSPTDDDLLEQRDRELREQEFAGRLPTSYNHRREPRVRLRKGTRRGQFLTLGTNRTKRAAFRAARALRDGKGEQRPLVVWRTAKGSWSFGTSAASVPASGDTTP